MAVVLNVPVRCSTERIFLREYRYDRGRMLTSVSIPRGRTGTLAKKSDAPKENPEAPRESIEALREGVEVGC